MNILLLLSMRFSVCIYTYIIRKLYHIYILYIYIYTIDDIISFHRISLYLFMEPVPKAFRALGGASAAMQKFFGVLPAKFSLEVIRVYWYFLGVLQISSSSAAAAASASSSSSSSSSSNSGIVPNCFDSLVVAGEFT